MEDTAVIWASEVRSGISLEGKQTSRNVLFSSM